MGYSNNTALKKAFHLIIGILCFIPLEACHHYTEELLNEIELTDSTVLTTNNLDTIQTPQNPSDSTRIPNNNTDSTYAPRINTDTVSTISFKTDTIIVAHWNIGNFAQGKSSNTSISSNNAKDMANNYHTFLDSLNIDILGICEYDPTFSKDGEKAQEVVFNDYPYYYIGKKYSYNCNAIFSKGELKDNLEHLFAKRVQTRYYTMSTIQVNDKSVIFVETHLDWNQGSNGMDIRKKQIDELIETLKDFHYVILCADFNISGVDEFQPFIDAGFTLANGGKHGTLNTYPFPNPKSPIDNIIVKGFYIIDNKVTGDVTLSDHLLIKSVLVIKH